MTRLRTCIALACVALAISCGKTESGAKTKPLTKVRVNFNPAMTYAPFFVARDEGFFADEGIDAELVSLDANSALVALTTGKLDVLSGPIRSGIFNMMLKGVPIQIVADRGHFEHRDCVTEAFAAPPALADAIAAKGGDLRGRQFALIRGGFTEFMIDKLLASRHLTRADVSFVQVPQGDSFTSGNQVLDAIRYVQEPTLSNHLTNGRLKVVAAADLLAPGTQHGVVLYGKRLLQDDPDLGRRFMRAYLRGARRYNEGKTGRNIAILSKGTRLPAEIIRRSCWLPISSDGVVRVENIQELLDWSRKLGYLQADVPVAQWWNSSFIDAANKSLGPAPPSTLR